MTGNVELRRSAPIGETKTDNQEVQPQLADVHSHSRHAAMTSGIEALSGVYGLLVSTLGIVLPLSLFLQGEYTYKKDGIYLTVFHMYVYVMALVFLFYTIIAPRMMKVKDSAVQNSNIDNRGKSKTGVYIINPDVEDSDDVCAENTENENKDKEVMRQTDYPPLQLNAPLIYEGTEGVNFFLRLGLVAFSIGAGLLEGFRAMQFAETDYMWDCFGVGYLILTVVRMLFLTMQTFILFKYHKIVMNFHKSVMKFGMMHMLASNICTWSMTIILEAVESYTHATASHEVRKRAAAAHGPTGADPPGDNTTRQVCEDSFPNTLATLAGPYLFPFLIEYSLLAAAIFYRMSSTIGATEFKEVQEQMVRRAEESTKSKPSLYHSHARSSQCHKAHSGLFGGLGVAILVGVAICFFLYYKTSEENHEITGRIHISTDISLNIVAGLILVPAFLQTNKLHFTATVGKMLDQNLLVLALLGYYLLLCFMAVAALSQTNEADPYGTGARLLGSMAIIDIVQATAQVFFITDGLRRRAVTNEHITSKPGRSLVTFLLICNISLWLVNTFMLKESYGFSTFRGYYGQLAWIIILNLTLPLAIYFRFHAAVCLSEIWLHTYKRTSWEKVALRDTEGCGRLL